jgi:hypothetical protein
MAEHLRFESLSFDSENDVRLTFTAANAPLRPSSSPSSPSTASPPSKRRVSSAACTGRSLALTRQRGRRRWSFKHGRRVRSRSRPVTRLPDSSRKLATRLLDGGTSGRRAAHDSPYLPIFATWLTPEECAGSLSLSVTVPWRGWTMNSTRTPTTGLREGQRPRFWFEPPHHVGLTESDVARLWTFASAHPS